MTDDEMGRLFALLAVPSISAMPQHADDMKRAAAMVAEEVRLAGGMAEVIVTSGHPLVVGEVQPSNGNPDAPVVLIYGHYDVQPPGDPSLWTSPAFAPTIRGDNLYCRGASDDKGNLFMLLVALQRMRAQGRLHVRARVLVDGEEESGGHSAADWVAADPNPPRAAVIFDAPMVGPGRPAVCTGLRGLAYFRVTVRGAAADLHSGMHGGAALNSAHALMQILSSVVPVDGRVPAPLAQGVIAPTSDEVTCLEHPPRRGRHPRRGWWAPLRCCGRSGVPPAHHHASRRRCSRYPHRQSRCGGHGNSRHGRGDAVPPGTPGRIGGVFG